MSTILKIFVVDDNEMQTMLLEDFITSKTDHEVLIFNTGEECLENLHEEPDVVILDYNLNSVEKDAANGAEILAGIKKYNDATKVIILSSQDPSGASLDSMAEGADHYVLKNEAAFANVVTIIRGING
jgi:DNA-binding NarL/FixJ family response regulator